MNTLGDDVTSLLSVAKHNVLIVAPFIRSEAFSRLLDCIPVGTEIKVVTRWRPADLLAGASDLDVYDLAELRGVPLFLRHDLHAKFFAGDDKCLVGSANVTYSALGWRTPTNFELLTPVARNADHIVKFETELFAGTVLATAEQRSQLADLLESLRGLPTLIPETGNEETTVALLPPNWVPRARNPDELYSVYRGNSDVSRPALRTMQEELAQIGIVPGMDEERFREWVAATISQTPLVSTVIQHIDDEGQMTEAVLNDLLAKIGVDTKEYRARDTLEVLERWLSYFLPARYETARDSIKLIKAKKL